MFKHKYRHLYIIAIKDVKLPAKEGRRTLQRLGNESLQPKAKDNTLKGFVPFCFDKMKVRFQNLKKAFIQQ